MNAFANSSRKLPSLLILFFLLSGVAGRVSPAIAVRHAPQITQSAADDFLDELAQDTWNYLHSDWATANHLPWSWRSANLTGGDYANPAEIGLYALSWLAAHDWQQPWSPAWSTTEAELTAILEQLRLWQTGAQSYQPFGPNAYNNSVFYQDYWVSWTPPVVGDGATNHIVPSIDNAWLAASLITIQAYAQANNHPQLANQALAILQDMDFTLWYDPASHLFYWGGVEDPQAGGAADYYSNENRLVNFIARALGQLSTAEYLASLAALAGPSGVYSGIEVEKMAWDGSYFTYTAPALFIREVGATYGLSTILPATQAQIAYAQDQGYSNWGLSDCFDIEAGDYMLQGSPPVAMPTPPETHPGLVTPHASALALITPLQPQAIANLQAISTNFAGFYHPDYGFLDSVMADPTNPDYGKISLRFSALSQEWILLSIINIRTGFLWNYFYQNAGVRLAHQEMFGTNSMYLPVVMR